ncbi:MAG: apolipoprotein N-acyltransferase [Nannocystaceae bacterium]|nr:apolipoprotein N-acyltransferase [bacterium]
MTAWLQARSTRTLAAIAFTGSLCFGLASPPSAVPALAWLGFIPLLLAAVGVRGRSGKSQFFVGWVGGLCTGLVGFPWIALTLERFAGFPSWLAFLGLFLFAAFTAVPYGLWVLCVARGPRAGVLRFVWAAASWVGLTTLWPAFFPYTPLIGLAQRAPWIQAAELGGVPAVEWIVLGFGYAVVAALLATQTRVRLVAGAVALALPALSWGLGSWRLAVLDAQAEHAPVVTFGIVQPNTALFANRRLDKMQRLWAMSAAAQAEGADVIVWPEAGIYPWVQTRPWTEDGQGMRRVLKAHERPTILGVATHAMGDPYEWNTAVVMNAQGEITASFDKTVLVPFGERIPIVDPRWAQRYVPAMSHNHAGEDPALFPVELADGSATYGAGPLICYEDIFADFAREVAAQERGIEFFVNVTIDTWFGDTAEPWEHLALAQFRSVEHRVPMVRSVAAGASSVVDHGGRLVASLPVSDPQPTRPVGPQRLVHAVALPRNTADAPTIYARGGWLLGLLCAVATVLVPLGAWGRRRLAAPKEPQPS